ncbi:MULTISPECIES: RHS repeat-associated core domain-containing protein [unclassified Luteibacter]|uniref:RHS repeat-associated core domain-containing protein n=1 Tax=Luteibacter sp. PvP019 TaxID=3156436 RepID=UPI003398DE79
MTDQPQRAPAPLAKDDFYSNAFGFYSHISGAVDPRTGMYSATIDLPTGKGNRLRGPHLEFRLSYSALNPNDDGFGVGWRLGLTELNRDTNMLTLGDGDSHRIEWFFTDTPATFPDRKLESFRLVPGAGNLTAVLTHATGVIEYLEPTPANSYVMRPVRIVNPGGNAIHLTWELGPHGGAVLTRVTDDEGVEMLRLAYPNLDEIQLRISTGSTDPVDMNFERLGDDLVRIRIPAIMELNAGTTAEEDEPVWAFGYRNTLNEIPPRISTGSTDPVDTNFERLGDDLLRIRIPATMELNAGTTAEEDEPVGAFGHRNTLDAPYLRMLTSIVSPDGIQDEVDYAERALELPPGAPRRYMPAVTKRRRTLVAAPVRPRQHGPRAVRSRFVQTSTYTYGNHGYNNFYGFPLVPDWQSRNDQLMQHGNADGFVYGSTETQRDEDDSVLCTIERDYNHFHLLTTETTRRGHVVQTVATTYGEVRGRPFRDQPTSFQLPHTIATTLYDDRNDTIRQVIVAQTTYDDYGNVLSRFDGASGVTERSAYYPLDGEQGKCPPDPFRLTRRLKQQTVEPGPGGGPTLSTYYRYCDVPLRHREGEADGVYVQACGEWTTLDDAEDRLSESQQGFVLDQGDQHGAIAWETRKQDGLTECRDFYYRAEAPGTLTTRTVNTTHDGLTTAEEETLTLVGGLTRQTQDALGNNVRFTYDSLARPEEQTHFRSRDEEIVVSRSKYFVTNKERWIGRSGITGLLHRAWLDEQGRLIEQEEPLPDGGAMTVREVVYNAFGETIEDIAFDRLAPDRTLALVSRFTYDDWGQCNDIALPDGSHIRSETALIERSGEVLTRTTTWREAAGQRVGGWQSTDTDAAGRQRFAEAGVWDAEGNRLPKATAAWRYDGLGRCVETIDAMNLVTLQTWDHFDRLIRTTLPDATAIVRRYAPGGGESVASIEVTPPGEEAGTVIGTRQHDGLGRMTEEAAGSLVTQLFYKPRQIRATTERHPGGGMIERTYDPWLDEALLSEVLLGSPPVMLKQATYDPRLGTPISFSSDSAAMTMRTDYLGRITEQQVTVGGAPSRSTKVEVSPGGIELNKTGADGMRQVFDCDDQGRLIGTRHCAPNGEVLLDIAFVYDALSRSVSRTARDVSGSVAEAVSYDELGRLASTTWTYEAGGTAGRRKLVFAWREDNKLVGKRWYGDDDRWLRDEAMDYDKRGRLIDHQILADTTDEFPIDDAGQAYRQQCFVYDCLDNLLSVTTTLCDGQVNVTTYEYDDIDRDRLTGVSSTSPGYPGYGVKLALRYDGNGNVVDDGEGRALAWDAAGRLTSMSLPDGKVIEYGYGPDGRIARLRRSGRTHYRYYDDGRLYGEFSDDDQRRYFRAAGIVVAESLLSQAIRTTWLLGNDPQGSVIVEAGEHTTLRTYGAYGGRDTTDDGARTGFAGEIGEEDTGWYLLGNRLYSPTLRRFLSPDGASPFDAGGLNRYAYCAGDPINRVDPSGGAWWDWLGVAVGVIASAVAIVATGGALLGVVAAAAAGSITAAVSTPTMAAMAASVVLEITSVAVEIGSAAAAEVGDEGAAGILGWLALGTGLATGALSAAPATGARASRFIGNGPVVAQKRAIGSLPPLPGLSKQGAGYSRRTYKYAGGRQVKSYTVSRQAAGNEIRLHYDKKKKQFIDELKPVWSRIPNGAGGYVYAPHTSIRGPDVSELLKEIPRNDGKNVIILTGVHGNEAGFNWFFGRRVLSDSALYRDDTYRLTNYSLRSGRNQADIQITDIGWKSSQEIRDLWNTDAHVVYATCFGAADAKLMKAFGIDRVKVFDL